VGPLVWLRRFETLPAIHYCKPTNNPQFTSFMQVSCVGSLACCWGRAQKA
jgi:hypothetical protein